MQRARCCHQPAFTLPLADVRPLPQWLFSPFYRPPTMDHGAVGALHRHLFKDNLISYHENAVECLKSKPCSFSKRSEASDCVRRYYRAGSSDHYSHPQEMAYYRILGAQL